MRRTLLLAFLLLPAACSTAGGTAPAREELAARDGEKLYRKRCASCHRLRAPSEQTGEGWTKVMTRMAPRAHLSGAERDAVLAWLRSRARDAAPER